MKRFSVALYGCLLLSLWGCTQKADAFTLSGTLLNPAAKAEANWYLYQVRGSILVPVDSMKGGGQVPSTLNFSVPNGSPRGVYAVGQSPAQTVMLVLAGKDLKAHFNFVTGQVESVNDAENLALLYYQAQRKALQNFVGSLNQRAEQLSRTYGQDQAAMNQAFVGLRQAYDSANKVYHSQLEGMAKQHANTLAAKIAKAETEVKSVEKPEALFASTGKDEELARTPVLTELFFTFVQSKVGQNNEAIKDAAKAALATLPAGSASKEVLLVSLAQLFAEQEGGFARSLITQTEKEYPRSAVLAAAKIKVGAITPEIGDLAPDIKLANPEGKEIPLSSLRGQVVLLDFWASWCGPCRRENPNVVSLYNRVKDKGFTVYSVSLDKEKNAWLKAIEADKLTWPNHVSDLKFWSSEGAKLYGVRSIPSTWLLDREGRIVAKGLRGGELDRAVLDLLANKAK